MVKKPDIQFIDFVQKKFELTDKQRRMLHEAISGQRLSKKEIEETAQFIKETYPNAR